MAAMVADGSHADVCHAPQPTGQASHGGRDDKTARGQDSAVGVQVDDGSGHRRWVAIRLLSLFEAGTGVSPP
jgi:hypothetical protein